MRFSFCLTLALLGSLIFLFQNGLALPDNANANGSPDISILTISIKGSINPAQVDYLNESIEKAETGDFHVLALQLDTPGGLGTSMREMVKSILNSPVPVVVWVGPSGARAASAGTFIVAASSAAGMSPQSTIGSAHPVNVGGGEIPETMTQKIMNDFLSLVRGMARSKGRNVQWYEKAVTESANITAQEAVKLNVVEYIAEDMKDFLVQAGRQGIEHQGNILRFDEGHFQIQQNKPGLRYKILSWLLHPQIAYFLLLGGIAGIFFELSSPGTLFPGILGGICLILGLYAMSHLPTNVAGLLLILLSVLFFILEIFITSYGMLGLAGIISLFFGSTILFHFKYGYDALPMSTIVVTVLGISALLVLAGYLVVKAHARSPRLGMDALHGQKGIVLSWSGHAGQVRVRGEVWSATSSTQGLQPDDEVIIQSHEGLTLDVLPRPRNSNKE